MYTKEHIESRSPLLLTELGGNEYLLRIRTSYPDCEVNFYIENPFSREDYEQLREHTDSEGEILYKFSKRELRGKYLIIIVVNDQKTPRIILRKYFPANFVYEILRKVITRNE